VSKTYNVDGIPNEMKRLPGWLYWVDKKIPKTLRKDPSTGKCNHNNPACLGSLEEVLQQIRHFNCKHGLAFSFRREFDLTYIDLDNCRDPETSVLTEFAQGIVERMNSYTEISPSRKGLHIVVRGQVERPRMHTTPNHAGRQIEIKPYGFYMTVTGSLLLGTPPTVEERQHDLSALYEELFGNNRERAVQIQSTRTRRASTAKRVQPRDERSLDRSADDFALCTDLVKGGLTDVQIEDVLTALPFMNRPKWRDRPDYRKKTIQAARKAVQQQTLTAHYSN
jgi:primase-polymerase (primpol)-like protein